MFAASTGSMLGVGGATALDTLCSQAITSVKPEEKPFVLRNYLQRGILFLALLFMLTTVPLWWFSGRLFIGLGQEVDFATDTGLFLRYLLFGGLLQVVAECLKKFLQVQGHSFQVGCAIGIAAVFGIGANVLFVRVLGLGFIGAPLAHTIYHLCTVTFLLIYTSTIPDSIPCWYGFRFGKWSDWSRFANMAVVGIVSQAAESFRYGLLLLLKPFVLIFDSFEILAMMAARLDQASIGAQGVSINFQELDSKLTPYRLSLLQT
jgi:MATE family multidrug resistance protein